VTTIPDKLVEHVARAMCEEMGFDPDEQNYWTGNRHYQIRRWQQHEAFAREAIAFQRAWERIKQDD
jgi:hypothetical protein